MFLRHLHTWTRSHTRTKTINCLGTFLQLLLHLQAISLHLIRNVKSEVPHTHHTKWNLCYKFPCSWLSPPPSCGPAGWLWGELSLFVPLFFCLVTPDQAADDHVKIKITKYKTGHSPDGEVKVQELGEGDPQWKHIKDVVKEQLEKAGLKPEGTKKGESLKGSLPFCVSHLWIFLSSSTTTL